jgi:hypothetical protein
MCWNSACRLDHPRNRVVGWELVLLEPNCLLRLPKAVFLRYKVQIRIRKNCLQSKSPPLSSQHSILEPNIGICSSP